MQSGTPLAPWALNKNPCQAFFTLASETGCLDGEAIRRPDSNRYYFPSGARWRAERERVLACLRSLDAMELIRVVPSEGDRLFLATLVWVSKGDWQEQCQTNKQLSIQTNRQPARTKKHRNYNNKDDEIMMEANTTRYSLESKNVQVQISYTTTKAWLLAWWVCGDVHVGHVFIVMKVVILLHTHLFIVNHNHHRCVVLQSMTRTAAMTQRTKLMTVTFIMI